MTPHRNWIKNYQPLVIPIQLADHKVIYSAGVGNVQFSPEVDGKYTRTLEFTKVLHVPALHSNLLSVLYLTQNKNFTVTIPRDRINFIQNKILLFTVSVNGLNTAALNGTVIPILKFAKVSNTSILDVSLWHRRFAHLNLDSVKLLIRSDLVDGLTIKSSEKPHTICEPCLAGKQHRNPFPTSTT